MAVAAVAAETGRVSDRLQNIWGLILRVENRSTTKIQPRQGVVGENRNQGIAKVGEQRRE